MCVSVSMHVHVCNSGDWPTRSRSACMYGILDNEPLGLDLQEHFASIRPLCHSPDLDFCFNTQAVFKFPPFLLWRWSLKLTMYLFSCESSVTSHLSGLFQTLIATSIPPCLLHRIPLRCTGRTLPAVCSYTVNVSDSVVPLLQCFGNLHCLGVA